jgi:hypothetical protein
MKKPTINITKNFIDDLWNIKGDKDKPFEFNIQPLRLSVYMFSIQNEDNYKDIKVSPYNVWKNTYSYFDEKGKRKYLMNYTSFLSFISKPTPYWNYDTTTKLIHFNCDHKEFYINWNSKNKHTKENKTDEYIVSPAYCLKYNEWEQMKISPHNELKLYFYILSEKLRGPYNFISISLNDLRTKLMIKNKSNKQLKIIMTKYLNDIKNKGIIYDFNFKKYTLTIQKRFVKPTK